MLVRKYAFKKSKIFVHQPSHISVIAISNFIIMHIMCLFLKFI